MENNVENETNILSCQEEIVEATAPEASTSNNVQEVDTTSEDTTVEAAAPEASTSNNVQEVDTNGDDTTVEAAAAEASTSNNVQEVDTTGDDTTVEAAAAEASTSNNIQEVDTTGDNTTVEAAAPEASTSNNVQEVDTTGDDATVKDTVETAAPEATTANNTQEVTNTGADDEPSASSKANNAEDVDTVGDDTTIKEPSASDEKSRENIHYEGDIAVYTDPATKFQYIWSNDKQEWVARDNTTYGFEDDTHTYTDADGIKYFWDKEKSAWFPKLDDDFMAMYQLNYGFIDNTQPEKEKPKEDKEAKLLEIQAKDAQALKRKEPPPEPKWFDVSDDHNTNVYVSNLPLNLSEQEFVDFMQKCGLVMREQPTGKMKVKLYTDAETKQFKGDALCTYIRIESVDLALKLLDGADLKGQKVKVERAKFQMKGTFDPTRKPKKRRKKDKDKFKRMQEKLFDWRPERMRGERAKHERIVIVKNVFESAMFDTDVGLILEFQQDLREECSKCGDVRKVIIYDRHPEGVAQVNMKEPEEADAVVQLLNGRWFGKRKLTAEIWNGKTKFKIAETDSQISQRLEKWDKFLESGEEDKSGKQNKPEEAGCAEDETTKT